MSDNITRKSYYKECQSIASEAVLESIKEHNGPHRRVGDDACERITETVDGHQWVIYYYYNTYVLRYSKNENAWEGRYSQEDMGALLLDAEKGRDGPHTVRACCAMTEDCLEYLEAEIDEQTEAWEAAQSAHSESEEVDA